MTKTSVLQSLDANRVPRSRRGNPKKSQNTVEEIPSVVSYDSENEDFPIEKESTYDSNANMDNDDGYLSPLVCSDDDDEEESDNSLTLAEAMKLKGKGRRSLKPDPDDADKQGKKKRRRRRSSARFLRLSGRFDGEEEDNISKDKTELGEMYSQAIRMNAENKINAGNSWGLKLIDNIDQFLRDDDDVVAGNGSRKGKSGRSNSPVSVEEGKRVNFTKASCTLDASVKIYSYRVDDVHLTSYKVLANLNRTDLGNNCNGKEGGSNEKAKPSSVGGRTQSEKRGVAETLEKNVASLNMSRLDSAYDIDPLFHKMSKTFDEGGAKGLLLVNLGVASDSCAIVFDSKEDSNKYDKSSESQKEINPANEEIYEGADETLEDENIDISTLSSKLETLLNGSTMRNIPLVPQLESLRDEIESLREDGFVEDEVPFSKSQRYANSVEEEKEAEKSIHREALERSRMSCSMANFTVASSVGGEEAEYGADDFGGNDNDDNDVLFNDFIAMDEIGENFSSTSFIENSFCDDVVPGTGKKKSSAMHFLDTICTDGAVHNGNEYGYFDTAALERAINGNLWAGASHWKKSEKIRKKGKAVPCKDTSKRKKTKKVVSFVDLSVTTPMDIFSKPSTSKKSRSDPLQQTEAAKKKNEKNHNTLPFDTGVGVEQLSRLFLRPNAKLVPFDEDYQPTKYKNVGFLDVDPDRDMMFPDEMGGSFGEDDGPGYNFCGGGDDFADADDYVVGDLDGVRKVKKVKVGYATIAKKVDVKRLKSDLWSELKRTTAVDSTANADKNQEQNDSKDGGQNTEGCDQNDPVDLDPQSTVSRPVSFKETVCNLESTQGQGDVTLPFYFICLLHLANEKGLRLDSTNLSDFFISRDDGSTSVPESIPVESKTEETEIVRAPSRTKRVKESATYQGFDESGDENDEDYE